MSDPSGRAVISSVVGDSLQAFLARAGLPPRELAPCLAPLKAEEVAQAYFFDSPFKTLEIDNDRTRFKWCDAGCGTLGWTVQFSTKEGRPINATWYGELLAIDRTLNPAGLLRGADGRGRVGHNRVLCIDAEFAGMGLGTELHRREEELYRKWGALEMQLEAACGALARGTWFRRGFVVGAAERRILEWDWENYQVGILEREPQNGLQELPMAWDDWDTGFRARRAEQGTLDMYKRLT